MSDGDVQVEVHVIYPTGEIKSNKDSPTSPGRPWRSQIGLTTTMMTMTIINRVGTSLAIR